MTLKQGSNWNSLNLQTTHNQTKLFVMGMWILTPSNTTTTSKIGTRKTIADLVSVADTYIAPIRLYSGTKDGKNKYTDVKDIPEKGTIAVPNDPTNESRALYVLESAGLIKLDTKDGELATISNIKDNPKNLTIS